MIQTKTRTPLPHKLRKLVYYRDFARCRYCHDYTWWDGYECDHIKAFSRGGSDHIWNLAAACESCNQTKRAKKAIGKWKPRGIFWPRKQLFNIIYLIWKIGKITL